MGQGQQGLNDLLLEWDAESRAAAFALEMAGKLPPRFTEHHYPLSRREQRELRRLKAAAAAATDIDTYVALTRGEPVPASRLNPQLVRYHRVRARVGR